MKPSETASSTTSSSLNTALRTAAYFLAYQYDRYWVKPDSALKYYGWILKYHSSSDQAIPSSKRITFLNQVLSDTSASQ